MLGKGINFEDDEGIRIYLDFVNFALDIIHNTMSEKEMNSYRF